MNWYFDTDAGVLTFFDGYPSGVSASVKPTITCWKYVGTKGVGSGGGSSEVNKSVRVATTTDLGATPSGSDLIVPSNVSSLFHSLNIDGVLMSVGDNILVKDQTDLTENGVYTIDSVDSSSAPWQYTLKLKTGITLETGQYSFVLEGDTNISTAWILQVSGSNNNYQELCTLVGSDNSVIINGNQISASKQEIEIHTNSTLITSNTTYTGITLGKNPAGKIMIYVENVLQELTENTLSDFYFKDPTETTVRTFATIVAGDHLFFNSVIAGYSLLAGDKVKLVYTTPE